MKPKQSSIGRRVGILLREARLDRELTQTEVAAAAGIPISSLSMLESGSRSLRFNLDVLRELALAVGYKSVTRLIADAEEELDVRRVLRAAKAG